MSDGVMEHDAALPVGLRQAQGELLKRVFDVCSAAVGLALLSPVLALAAAAVLIDSPGPVFYRGLRSGRNGAQFRIFKFRSMVVDAEQLGGMSTGKNDKRVTRAGAFLRRHKIDELPQLINVLQGDMSIVGPRPEMPAYTALYRGEELLILTVRPGITDYASLRFSRLDEALGDTAPDAVYENQIRPIKNALRVKYVKGRSFPGDLRIVARTILLLLGLHKCSTPGSETMA